MIGDGSKRERLTVSLLHEYLVFSDRMLSYDRQKGR
jgi:hypothetical protein